MLKVFLSASVPLPERDPRFIATADVVAIRDAVKALVSEVVPRGCIVFGGHPAITPLVALLLQGVGGPVEGRVILYQSGYFEGRFPKENRDFPNVRIVPKVSRSRRRSLHVMRERMIKDTDFDVGVFIGGMEGVLAEFDAFRVAHPSAQLWPVASTGAAASEIFDTLDRPHPELFEREVTYASLFRRLLSELH